MIKKTYETPVLVKREKLEHVAAAPDVSHPGPV